MMIIIEIFEYGDTCCCPGSSSSCKVLQFGLRFFLSPQNHQTCTTSTSNDNNINNTTSLATKLAASGFIIICPAFSLPLLYGLSSHFTVPNFLLFPEALKSFKHRPLGLFVTSPGEIHCDSQSLPLQAIPIAKSSLIDKIISTHKLVCGEISWLDLMLTHSLTHSLSSYLSSIVFSICTNRRFVPIDKEKGSSRPSRLFVSLSSPTPALPSVMLPSTT